MREIESNRVHCLSGQEREEAFQGSRRFDPSTVLIASRPPPRRKPAPPRRHGSVIIWHRAPLVLGRQSISHRSKRQGSAPRPWPAAPGSGSAEARSSAVFRFRRKLWDAELLGFSPPKTPKNCFTWIHQISRFWKIPGFKDGFKTRKHFPLFAERDVA
jgi:hypothetical protein